MTIAELREKCKVAVAKIPRDTLVLGILVLASSASFGLGYLAGRDTGQGSEALATPLPTTAQTDQATGQVVASKNGTKYYLPSCAGASRIADANKVWFVSASAATEAGYAPAANCNGL